jgi:hypothetical protein
MEARTWNEQQQVYISWLALPRANRPTQLQELAKQLGVAKSTLHKWRHLPGFMDAVFDKVRQHLDESMAAIMKALADKAEAGDVGAIRLCLVVTGRLEEGREGTVILIKYGADEFAEIANEVRKWRRDRFEDGRTIDGRSEDAGEGEMWPVSRILHRQLLSDRGQGDSELDSVQVVASTGGNAGGDRQ